VSPPAILGDRNAPTVLHQTAQPPKPGGHESPGFNYEKIQRPNGITLSLDEKILYVDDTEGEFVYAFHVQPDGRVMNRLRPVPMDPVGCLCSHLMAVT
jgi:hypothetical protein